MRCELRTLLFTGQPARAQLVRLTDTWQRIAGAHDYPEPVKAVLGELVAAAALLSASLKFNGALVLQIKGDGPIRMMVAECSSQLGLRAMALFDTGFDWTAAPGFKELVNRHGNGRFVMILDPHDRLPGQQPYQGIIALQSDGIAQAIEAYMQQSEQLQTRLWLASDAGCTAGLLLQQMPGDGGILSASPSASSPAADDADGWTRLTTLGDTIKAEELLQLESAQVAHRLFWQETHETLAVRQPAFQCSCSRDKVARMLRSLGEPEVNEALKEQGRVAVNCDYCNTAYDFDAVDCRALFINDDNGLNAGSASGGSGALH